MALKNKTGVQPKNSTVIVPPQQGNNDQQQELNVQEGDTTKKGTICQ